MSSWLKGDTHEPEYTLQTPWHWAVGDIGDCPVEEKNAAARLVALLLRYARLQWEEGHALRSQLMSLQLQTLA